MNLRSDCLRYSEYQSIYSESTRLQVALCKYYATFIRFCRKVIQDHQRESKLNIIPSRIIPYIWTLEFRTMSAALWRPFEVEFGTFQKTLRAQSEEVRQEIAVSSEKAADHERHLQLIERSSASRHRIRADLHRREEQIWRQQYLERISSKWFTNLQSNQYNQITPFR